MPKKLTTEEFIDKAKLVHGDKYDYSKVEYVNNRTKVCIICKKHGEFLQQPISHLNGKGCSKCNGGVKMNLNDIVEKSKIIHNNVYKYDKSTYNNVETETCIICKKHGEFYQSWHSHLQGHGCPKCSHRSYKYTVKEFTIKANKIHINKYDYSKTKYINVRTKIIITCPIHGDFKITPNKHLLGQGCPICKESHLEKEMAVFLINNEISFERQQKFDWLGLQSLDFFLPQYNIAIECQGKQHFGIGGWNSEEHLKLIKERDQRKLELCNENGVKLLYFSNLGIDYPYEVFEDKELLLNEILKKNECKTN